MAGAFGEITASAPQQLCEQSLLSSLYHLETSCEFLKEIMELGLKPVCLTLEIKFSPSTVWVLGLHSGCQAWWQVH